MKKYILSALSVLMCLGLSAQVSKPGRNYVNFTVVPTHADAVYAVGDTAALRVVATAGGAGLDGVTLRYESGPDNLAADRYGEAGFRNGEALVPFGTMDRPGFRYCKVSFSVAGQNYQESVKVGFSPERLEPYSPCPSDFDSFWKKTLAKASKVPMEYEITPDSTYTTDRVEGFRVKLQAFEKGNYIYGYLLKPRDGKKHPVLFNPPGAGVKKIASSPEYAEAGYLFFSIGVNGIPMDATPDALKARQQEIGNYWTTGLESPETYYYRKVYCACVRCIDFLMSLPEWDGVNVGVTGGSQGGALTIVTAGLDPRVTFIAAFYPALCLLDGYAQGHTGGWPNLYRNGAEPAPGLDRDRALRTFGYYDVVNFAARVQCPGFYSYGYNDNTCPPTSTATAVNRVTAPKTVVVTPSSGHWRFGETQQQCFEWMAGQLK